MGKLYVNKLLQNVYYNKNSNLLYGSLNDLYKYCQAQKDVKKKDVTRKKIKEWLQQQDVYTLHYKHTNRFKRNHYMIFQIDQNWQLDLIDFRSLSKQNDGFNWILICIDVFSKFLWAEPLKKKTGFEVTKAMNKILKSSNRKCEEICSDYGKEFNNQIFANFLKNKNIKQQFAYNPIIKCSIAERSIRTIKSRIYQHFTCTKSKRYIDVLQNLIKTYNYTTHSTIKKKPALVNPKNALEVYETLKKKYSKDDVKFPDLLRNDIVKVHRMKFNIFRKGYVQQWSTENFIIDKVYLKIPYPMYSLKDKQNVTIKGRYYKEELQKVFIS